jgi:VanZ family protein
MNIEKHDWKSFLIYQSPPILFAIFLFVYSSIPDPFDIKLNFGLEDKLKHFAVYAVFGFLIVRALYYTFGSAELKRKIILWAIIVGVVYGVSDEIHQYFVPGRNANYYDVLADSFGVIFGVFVFDRNKKRIKSDKKSTVTKAEIHSEN